MDAWVSFRTHAQWTTASVSSEVLLQWEAVPGFLLSLSSPNDLLNFDTLRPSGQNSPQSLRLSPPTQNQLLLLLLSPPTRATVCALRAVRSATIPGTSINTALLRLQKTSTAERTLDSLKDTFWCNHLIGSNFTNIATES